jgi:hypothetical protein
MVVSVVVSILVCSSIVVSTVVAREYISLGT